MANHEWFEQVRLARLLDRWIDPQTTFWTATDPVTTSPLAGFMRKKRGVKAGVPDTLIWHRRRSVVIELKGRAGRCNPAQREVRKALLRAGCQWWACKSANAAMWALKESGVKFRVFVSSDGAVERWRQPALEPWEVPRRDPSERRPMHPRTAAQRREAARRRRERQRALKAAQATTERADATAAST